MSSLMNKVKVIFKKRPFIANCLSYGSVCVGAEFTQQVLEKKYLDKPHEAFDKPHLARYALMGTGILSPMSYYWYKWLDTTFSGATKHATVQKLLLDQIIMRPVSLIVFFVGMSLLEFSREPFRECREKFWRTYQEALMLWLPAQTINFTCIPSKYRMVYISLITFVWINILCLIKRGKH